jgi:hypothetical protein
MLADEDTDGLDGVGVDEEGLLLLPMI